MERHCGGDRDGGGLERPRRAPPLAGMVRPVFAVAGGVPLRKKIIGNPPSIATKTLRRGKNGRKNTISDGSRAVE
jgi:hypothetical protein